MAVIFAEGAEWVPLGRAPERRVRLPLQISKISGNRTEFESYRGTRYLRVQEADGDRWFSKRDRYVTRVEKAGLKRCCSKLRLVWEKFMDLGKNGKNCRATPQAVIFAKEVSPNQITQKQRTFEIRFCPSCGKHIQFG